MYGQNILHFHRSRFKHILLLMAALFMLSGCFLLIVEGRNTTQRTIGWGSGVVIGYCLYFVVRGLIEGGVALTFDSTGFIYHRLHADTVPWSEVQYFIVRTSEGRSHLCFRLHNPEVLTCQLSTNQTIRRNIGRTIGLGDLCICFIGFDLSIEVAVAYLKAHGVQERY